MKQLALFLLLTLFVISCGDDSPIESKTEVIPMDRTKTLNVLQEGAKFYFENTAIEEGNKESYRTCIEYKDKETYQFEGESVDVFYKTTTILDNNEIKNSGLYFFYKDYVYNTVTSKLVKGIIREARIYAINKLDEVGDFYIDDMHFEASIDEFALDGKRYEAWKIVLDYGVDEGEHWIKYVPGIGLVAEYFQIDGSILKQELYKYELN